MPRRSPGAGGQDRSARRRQAAHDARALPRRRAASLVGYTLPTPEEEDARRAHRELEQLRQERKAHANRIRSLLVWHNRRVEHVGGRDWAKWCARHGPELPAALRAGIEREMTRLVLVKAQIKTLEAQQCKEVAGGLQPQVAQLSRVRGVGLGGAWILVKELFGWRRLAPGGKRMRRIGIVTLARHLNNPNLEHRSAHTDERRQSPTRRRRLRNLRSQGGLTSALIEVDPNPRPPHLPVDPVVIP